MDSIIYSDVAPDEFVFITLVTCYKRKVFIRYDVNKYACDALKFHIEQNHVQIGGFVIMPDHIHLMVRTVDWDYPDFVKNYKTFTGDKIKKTVGFSKKLWRRRFFDIPIIGPVDFHKRLDKMHTSPVKNGLAENPEEYLWSSLSNYSGEPGYVPVTLVKPPKC
ncbi:MAG TPA: transposase [bacterium]|nr:transposase [bacterium]